MLKRIGSALNKGAKSECVEPFKIGYFYRKKRRKIPFIPGQLFRVKLAVRHIGKTIILPPTVIAAK